MLLRSIILFVSVLVAGWSAVGLAQDSALSENPDRTEDVVRDLVARLASPQFAERQKATAEILTLDAESVPFLQSELEKATGETADRLRPILPQLYSRLFTGRLEEFTKDPTRDNVAGLPEWSRFAAITGDADDALSIFVEVLRAEPGLFATRVFSPRELPAVLETRSAAFAKRCHGRDEEEFPIAACVALMLLGSDPDIRLIRATSTNISDAFDDPRFSRLVEDGVHSGTLKSIIGTWINRSGPGFAVDRPLLFAIRHELPAGRSLAHRVIQSGATNQSMYYALLCLARLNSPEDLPIVESAMNSDKKLWPPRGQTVQKLLPDARLDSSFSVQTRDVALAVAMHLRGRNPRDFGMEVISSDETVFIVHSMGFENDEARKKVIANYRLEYPTAAKSK